MKGRGRIMTKKREQREQQRGREERKEEVRSEGSNVFNLPVANKKSITCS